MIVAHSRDTMRTSTLSSPRTAAATSCAQALVHSAALAIVLVGLVACADRAPSSDESEARDELNGGVATAPGELPAVGTIPGCTATLIGQDVVLTAAHCVCTSGHGGQPEANTCVARRNFTMSGVFPADDPSTAADGLKTRRDVSIAGTVTRHPDFERVRWLSDDYAIIVLDRRADALVSGVTPMPVTPPDHAPRVGETLTLVGYGSTGNGCTQGSAGKRKLSLAVSDVGPGHIRFDATNLHNCPGDSGGPVINAHGEITGVASWGNFQDQSTYRPTHSVHDWITSFVDDAQGATCSTAAAMPLAGSVGSAIDYAGDQDYYALHIPFAGDLNVQATSTLSTDTYGKLLDSACATLAEDDDSGADRSFSMARKVGAGTHFIAVRHYDAKAGTGPYALTVTFLPGPDDHANTASLATHVVVPGSTAGSIEYGGDRDFFLLALRASGALSIRTEGTTDTHGILYGSGTEGILAENDDTRSGRNFAIERVLAPGRYYVMVEHHDPRRTGVYTLVADFAARDDHGDACASATAVATVSGTPGSIGRGGDIDTFRVEIDSRRPLVAQTSGSTDTTGYLLGAACTVIASDDDSGTDANFRILRVVEPGTYYIAVRHHDRVRGTGNYKLWINRIE